MNLSLVKINRILLIRTSSFGDIILTTPLIRALKASFPSAQMDFFTKKQYQSLLEHHPSVKVFGFDPEAGFFGLAKAIRELRAKKYDLVIDLQVNPRSILIRYFSGARMQRRYRKYSLERRLLKWGINLLKSTPPVAERYFSALEDFGIKPNGKGPEIFFSEKELSQAKQILESAGLLGMPLIGLAPGASKFTKQWPAERFAKAGAALARELFAGAVILGGKEDAGVAEEVRSGLQAQGVEKVKNLAGELSLLASSAVISRLKLLISNDSALMHLATAVDTPVAAIFGATTRELGFFPYSRKARVLEINDLECRPCSLHGEKNCPEKHFRCMLEIEPEQVVEAAKNLLEQFKDDGKGAL